MIANQLNLGTVDGKHITEADLNSPSARWAKMNAAILELRDDLGFEHERRYAHDVIAPVTAFGPEQELEALV